MIFKVIIMIEVKFIDRPDKCDYPDSAEVFTDWVNPSYIVSITEPRPYNSSQDEQPIDPALFVRVKMHDGSYYYMREKDGIELRDRLLGSKNEIITPTL